MQREQLVIRRLEEGDSFAELTTLLHRAYAPLAAAGLRFGATQQTEDETKQRALGGECYVAELDGVIVGTITLRSPGPCAIHDRVKLYADPGVYAFEQLGIEPVHKGRGIGKALMDHVEGRAKALGGARIACDTSERATQLVEMYVRRGYEIVDTVQWDETNYRSVVLAKRL
ncbi:MAG: GNAT family N-acetyltransferase [Polyangiaceae bacterium]|nr:GNAT family N-acetyltransferase [Polyangiaceae bacterium]